MFKDISSKLPEALISHILTKESILNIEVFITIYQVLYLLQVNIDVLKILDSLIATLIMFYYTGILEQYRGYIGFFNLLCRLVKLRYKLTNTILLNRDRYRQPLVVARVLIKSSTRQLLLTRLELTRSSLAVLL